MGIENEPIEPVNPLQKLVDYLEDRHPGNMGRASTEDGGRGPSSTDIDYMARHIDRLLEAPLVGFSSSWAGNIDTALATLRFARSLGVRVVYQIGGFGVSHSPDTANYLSAIQRTLDELDMLLIVVLGETDDSSTIANLPTTNRGWISSNSEPMIWYAPRGFTWSQQHVKFAAVRPPEQRNVIRTSEDLDMLSAYMSLKGWHQADILLSYRSPAQASSEDEGSIAPVLHAIQVANPAWVIHGSTQFSPGEISLPKTEGDAAKVSVLEVPKPENGGLVVAALTPIVGIVSPKMMSGEQRS